MVGLIQNSMALMAPPRFQAAVVSQGTASQRAKTQMPNRILCPKCRGQRTTLCDRCRGSGKRSVAGVTIGRCKECNGTGQRRCDVCGGTGEFEPKPSEPRGAPRDFE